ncbi:TlpA family protein disulfide reductase [Flavobacterium sp. F-380]|uniref:TlpA family protein disulfide reductase n=1 Tax=Flavobacterium kayseriense TaxID=2764714 RepID=A0ABR7J3Y2_9FLAO|nr:TlpA disulfide reductase family protein [Flavobacterium kayseriense]MBC5840259.1 TlpA family protein disulfide reductase [Flavobacterium kayseriense]MBC5847071.1 TlpA family protein disulfide reductase [Flavobacterium kayseriense]
MNKVLFMLVALLITVNISSQDKKYATVEFDVANQQTDSLFIWSIENKIVLLKILKKDKNGVFKDTVTVKPTMHLLSYTRNSSIYNTFYLANGFDLKISLDTNKWGGPMQFSGKGADENNLFQEVPNSFPDDAVLTDDKNFKTEFDKARKFSLSLIEGKKLNPEFYTEIKKQIEDQYLRIETRHKFKVAQNKLNNTVSPNFSFINYKGGQSTLEDFKGKYVYIDIWATWCAPCIREIPYLQKIEELYHGENIAFLSISSDQYSDIEKWKKMIVTKSMSGVQLLEDNRVATAFSTYFNVDTIPRFILIDPKGVIIDSNTLRPSDPLLIGKLDGLLNK